jgi:hypothetical protein
MSVLSSHHSHINSTFFNSHIFQPQIFESQQRLIFSFFLIWGTKIADCSQTEVNFEKVKDDGTPTDMQESFAKNHKSLGGL